MRGRRRDFHEPCQPFLGQGHLFFLTRIVGDEALVGLQSFLAAQFFVAHADLKQRLGRDVPLVGELHDEALEELDGTAQVSLRLYLQESGLVKIFG